VKTSRSSLIKLGLGLGMIVASVIGVSALVSSISKTHAMVLAAIDMPVGHTITARDVVQTDGYVVGSGIIFAGSTDELVGKITTRPLAAGEPLSNAVASDSFDLDLTTLVVSVGDGVPASLVAGDTIEVWSAGTRGVLGSGVDVATPQSGEPRPLAAGEFVARIGDAQTAALGGMVQVEIVVAKADVSVILAAQTRDEKLVVLPHRSHSS
jgi:hypothetical protein